MSRVSYSDAQSWLIGRIGDVPNSSLGWFRAGVGTTTNYCEHNTHTHTHSDYAGYTQEALINA